MASLILDVPITNKGIQCFLKLYFNVTMLTEIHSYWLIECNLTLTYPIQFGPKTQYVVKKKIFNLVYFSFITNVYIKDPP